MPPPFPLSARQKQVKGWSNPKNAKEKIHPDSKNPTETTLQSVVYSCQTHQHVYNYHQTKPISSLDVFVVGRDDVRHRPELGECLAERVVELNWGVYP